MKSYFAFPTKTFLRGAAFFAILLTPVAASAQQQQHYLYRTELIQATPGKFVELVDLFKQKAAIDQQAGDEPALWMRHSQGDRWDSAASGADAELRSLTIPPRALNFAIAQSKPRASQIKFTTTSRGKKTFSFTGRLWKRCAKHSRKARSSTWKCLSHSRTSGPSCITNAKWKTHIRRRWASPQILFLCAIRARRGIFSPSAFSAI